MHVRLAPLRSNYSLVGECLGRSLSAARRRQGIPPGGSGEFRRGSHPLSSKPSGRTASDHYIADTSTFLDAGRCRASWTTCLAITGNYLSRPFLSRPFRESGEPLDGRQQQVLFRQVGAVAFGHETLCTGSVPFVPANLRFSRTGS
jgi:hypothetical protein